MISVKDLIKETIDMDIDEKQVEQFNIYLDFMLEYNKKINLTAITDPDEAVMKHFVDSVQVLKYVDLEPEASVCDVGTGAGFPGVPMKILRPDIKLTLLDSLNKRIVFLEQLLEKLDLDAKLIHGRAEDVGKEYPFRDGYDLVVSRAVTLLPALCEYAIPLVAEGGSFVAYKGPEYGAELENAKSAMKKLKGKTKKIHKLTLPDGSQRTLIEIEKTDETPDKYPRTGVKITKKPL